MWISQFCFSDNIKNEEKENDAISSIFTTIERFGLFWLFLYNADVILIDEINLSHTENNLLDKEKKGMSINQYIFIISHDRFFQ
jgi:hypothetical protein